MALSQSALSELLEAFRTGDGVDMIRESAGTVLQELLEFEAAGVIGLSATNAARTASPNAMAPDRSCWRPRPVTSSCGSPSCGGARSSPPSSSRAVGSTRPCMRW